MEEEKNAYNVVDSIVLSDAISPGANGRQFPSLRYGELPGPDEALEVLQRSKEDRLAGRYRPIEEAIADWENIVARHREF